MKYYEAKRGAVASSPNEYYREHMQQLIDTQWDNTVTMADIKEEYPFASFQFKSVNVHMTHALDKSTGMKQGDDFRELIFQDIDYSARMGTYYQFDNSYWLAINLEEFNLVSKNVIVRRCNNALKWKDANGTIHSHPCILEYEVTSSSPLVDNNIITPNNKIRVIIQANEDTLGLKVNKRFIFGGRPFEIVGYNDYMLPSINGEQNIMYIHTQLTEILPYDDFVNGIAYNEEVNIAPTPPEIKNGIVVEPIFDFVRQNYTMTFDANLYINNVKQGDIVTAVDTGAPNWAYEFNSLGNNKFSIKCKKVAKVPLQITFACGEVTKTILIDLKSMF